MSFTAPVLPVIYAGPAIVTWNSKTYYFKNGIKADFIRETFAIETDIDGKIDERMKSQMTKVSGTPVGAITTSLIAGMFPYAIGSIGSSIFTSTNKPLVIVTKFGGTGNLGQTITFPRAAVTKYPQLRLKPTDTLWGDIEFTCLGDPTVQPNTSTAWQTLASATFADTTFDETAIITDMYTAAYGSSPYAAIGSMNGFEVDIQIGLNTITADDFGIVDMTLKEITGSVKFAPSNLTEAQVYTLLANQDTGYIYPGQSLAKSNTDLVITGSGNGAKTLTFTLKNAGPKAANLMYEASKHRFESVEFTSKRTWTSGAANNLYTTSLV